MVNRRGRPRSEAVREKDDEEEQRVGRHEGAQAEGDAEELHDEIQKTSLQWELAEELQDEIQKTSLESRVPFAEIQKTSLHWELPWSPL